MAEEEIKQPEAMNLEGVGLQDSIARWVEALDAWVKGFDKGMGGQAGGADANFGKDGSVDDAASPESGEAS
jgi:hypothetical protein